MFAGALPFAACALLMAIGYEQLPVLGRIDLILSSYAFAIAAFMLGVYWGLCIGHLNSDKQSFSLMLLSNLLFLLAWFCFLLDINSIVFYAVLLYIFVKLLLIDRRLLAKGAIEKPYYQARFKVTIVVTISLLSAMFSLGLSF